MLAELMRLKYGIAVAGAHGKTTTTSMVASVLAAAGSRSHVRRGRPRESDRHHRAPRPRRIHGRRSRRKRPQLLLLAPVVAVVTTIDREHLDQYASLEEIQDTFTQFVNRVPFYGAAVLCLDEPNVQAIIPNVKRPVITYGTSSQADLVISDMQLQGLGQPIPPDLSRRRPRRIFHLPRPPGIHNVRNAAAAAAVALLSQRPRGFDSRQAWKKFAGVGRRFDVKGVIDGITLIDDYGHHPGRDSRHARSRARLQLRAPAGALPAASLHAHPASLGRFLPRLQSGRRAGA